MKCTIPIKEMTGSPGNKAKIIILVSVTLLFLMLLLLPMSMLKVPSFLLFENSDKVIHTGMFFTLGLSSASSMVFMKSRLKRLLVSIGFCLVLALASELVQSFIPSRTMDVYDFLADISGMAAATLLFILFIYYRRYRLHLVKNLTRLIQVAKKDGRMTVPVVNVKA